MTRSNGKIKLFQKVRIKGWRVLTKKIKINLAYCVNIVVLLIKIVEGIIIKTGGVNAKEIHLKKLRLTNSGIHPAKLNKNILVINHSFNLMKINNSCNIKNLNLKLCIYLF